mgnify:CR=1 FL=1
MASSDIVQYQTPIRKIGNILIGVFLAIYLVWTLLTFVMMFVSSLKDLLDCLETDDKELVDKADLVRAGLKHKKMNKDAWSSDPLIQSQFMSVVSAL